MIEIPDLDDPVPPGHNASKFGGAPPAPGPQTLVSAVSQMEVSDGDDADVTASTVAVLLAPSVDQPPFHDFSGGFAVDMTPPELAEGTVGSEGIDEAVDTLYVLGGINEYDQFARSDSVGLVQYTPRGVAGLATLGSPMVSQVGDSGPVKFLVLLNAGSGTQLGSSVSGFGSAVAGSGSLVGSGSALGITTREPAQASTAQASTHAGTQASTHAGTAYAGTHANTHGTHAGTHTDHSPYSNHSPHSNRSPEQPHLFPSSSHPSSLPSSALPSSTAFSSDGPFSGPFPHPEPSSGLIHIPEEDDDFPHHPLHFDSDLFGYNPNFSFAASLSLPATPQSPPARPDSPCYDEVVGLPHEELRRENAADDKTPTEYTLHIIFTQFVRLAERKLAVCADHPLSQEAPVIETLAEGVDREFDKCVALLGFIAKRKPKPVIDLVMFWRKSKSEVAAMAAVDLERHMLAAHSEQEVTRALPSPLAPGIVKKDRAEAPPGALGRAKRSLLLMRTRLFQFGALGHRRHQLTGNLSPAGSIVSKDGPIALNQLNRALIITQGPSFAVPTQPGLVSPGANALTLALALTAASQLGDVTLEIAQKRTAAIVAERKLLALIYILCRVLIEIVKQATDVAPDLRGKLEEIVYTQLKTTDPVLTAQLLTRLANWTLFCELLGHMSHRHFVLVLDRFIGDLEQYARPGTAVLRHQEALIHLLIHGMRFLQLRTYPPEEFEETLEFVKLLAKFLAALANDAVVYAYCEVVGNMLLPLASAVTAETNHPVWAEAMAMLYAKGEQMWAGAGAGDELSQAWLYLLHLMTAVLSCSRKELFDRHWFALVQHNSHRLRPKVELDDRITYVVCVARLFWVFINRLPDTLNNTHKKIDAVFDMLLFSGSSKKTQWLTNDPYLVGPLVEMVRIAGHTHLAHVLDNVILRALGQAFNGSLLEGMQLEKIIVLIRAYLLILEDYELGSRPKFPLDEVLSQRIRPQPAPGQLLAPVPAVPEQPLATTVRLREFAFAARTLGTAASHDEVCRTLAQLLKVMDATYGARADGSDDAVAAPGSKFYLHFGLDFAFGAKPLHLDVFTTLLEAVPWTMGLNPEVVPYKLVVELLTRNVSHHQLAVALAAMAALRKMALKRHALTLVTVYAKIAFGFVDKPLALGYNPALAALVGFRRMLKLYVELLTCWLTAFRDWLRVKAGTPANPLAQADEKMSKDVLNDLYQVNVAEALVAPLAAPGHKASPLDELEWKQIINVIEEVEGNGLFFLCLTEPKVRHHGLAILRIVSRFDRAMSQASDPPPAPRHTRSPSKFAADIGTRLIDILEHQSVFELIEPMRAQLTSAERARVAKLEQRGPKGLLVRVCELDYGLDATLWARVFPQVVDVCFVQCPMPVAICRLVICTRMVQMHAAVVAVSEDTKSLTLMFRGLLAPPELLVNQWKLYLMFACCLLTSTTEQRLALPAVPQEAPGRKKPVGVFLQHQQITLAKLVLRMVQPLLLLPLALIRDAVRQGLSCINVAILRPLLENLPAEVSDWLGREPAKDRVRVEIVHILAVVMARFEATAEVFADEWMVANIVNVVKTVKTFLLRPEVQAHWEFQRLRRFFCQFLHHTLAGLQRHRDDVEKWLPFEARIACFLWLQEWCGFGANRELELERYQAMYKAIGDGFPKELAALAAKLEVERIALHYAALRCMAVIVALPILHEITPLVTMLFDIPQVMAWIKLLMVYHGADQPELAELRWLAVGETAFRNVVDANLARLPDIANEVVRELFALELARLTRVYFCRFVAAYVRHPVLAFAPDMHHQAMCVGCFLVGHPLVEVRLAAMDLLDHLVREFVQVLAPVMAPFRELALLLLKVVYKKALFDISTQLAGLQPLGTPTRLLYMTKYFGVVTDAARRDILACLLPWMLTVVLEYDDDEVQTPVDESGPEPPKPLTRGRLDATSLMILNNLFEITFHWAGAISNEVEALWVALGLHPANFDKILDFILLVCLERKAPEFVQLLKQIVDYLCFNNPLAGDVSYMFHRFVDNMHPRLMVPPQAKPFTTDVAEPHQFPFVADVGALVPYNEKEPLFLLGQLALTFCVDLFAINAPQFADKLAFLTHVLVALLDHYLPLIHAQALEMLIHLILAAPRNDTDDTRNATIAMLRRRDPLWTYDDLNTGDVCRGARTPANMDELIRNLLQVIPGLQQQWLRVLLHWATTCAVRHIACRLFQVFRLLLTFLDQAMLRDMLHRLSNTIADDTGDIQGFAMQILMTLNAITAELDSENLIDFPQLFWLAVACLLTVHQPEFVEGLSTMAKFVEKIDLGAPDTISCLIATFPPKWEGRFDGLHAVIVQGTRSGTSWDPTIKFLDKLITIGDLEIVGQGDARLVQALVPNLPRFLHALLGGLIPPDVEACALNLAALADTNGKPHLLRILVLVAKNRFRSKDDFLALCLLTLRQAFFPVHQAPAVAMLMAMLPNSIPWVRQETLKVLGALLPHVDLQAPEFVGVGAELILPLLRLLLTDDADAALQVLDEVATIQGLKFDRETLRASMGPAPGSTPGLRRDDKPTALFGAPDASGWAIASPAATAARTRNNVHAVYLTCAAAKAEKDDDHDATIEFHREPPLAAALAAPDADTASMAHTQHTEERDALLLNVWAALDDLDLFFTKDHPPAPPVTPHPEPVPGVYENDVLFILNRSLARTRLNILFRTGLADTPQISTTPPPLLLPLVATRRSYIPFRTKRLEVTPTLGHHLQFEGLPQTGSPYANGAQNSLLTIMGDGSPPELGPPVTPGGGRDPPAPMPHHSPLHFNHLPLTRFENLLGNLKKRSRKLLVSLPVLVVHLLENPAVATANILNQPVPPLPVNLPLGAAISRKRN